MKRLITKHQEFSHLGESELITLAQKGNTEAFSPLVHKYQRQIYNLIYQKVHDRETAKDLCQEAFFKAWRALPNFKGKSTFYNWLYQIAVNCSIDFLRRQKNEIVFAYEELPQNTDIALQMVHVQSSSYQILEREELALIIREAPDHLSSHQRRVFYLRHRDGFMIKEIALRLNKSEGTIKTHLYNAHQKLRDLLRPYLENKPLEWYKGT